MSLPATVSDADLLRLMMAGDEAAFTTLYRRRQGGIYRFALQMTGSPALAEDVTQEVFLVLMRQAVRFDPERGTVASFLYGIARNHMLRRLEQERRFVALAADDEDGGTIENLCAESDPHAELASKEAVETVRRAVLSLPERYREAVVLCDLHELSYEDAANIIDCAVGTLRSRLHRGRALLSEKLIKSAPESQTKPMHPARVFV
jgi:RNA polymerase sigma-70 factor (ECF subfamily)